MMKVFMVMLGLLLILARGGEGRVKCGSRNEMKKWRKMLPKLQCRDPVDQLVPLPIPHGYDWIHPDVVILKKCKGHHCLAHQHECIGNRTVDRNFVVEAYKMGDTAMQCVNISIKEDIDCVCKCMTGPEQCTKSQEFDEHLCQCNCLPQLKLECEENMKQHPDMYMWDPVNCSCPCNNKDECSSNKYWVPALCSCRSVMEHTPSLH